MSNSPEQTNGSGSRFLMLDGLRALAICLVMIHHFTQEMTLTGPGDRLFFAVANSCWIGVDLFFVLSGFLITGILYDAKGASNYFKVFYMRRVLRIFPIYYAFLLVIFVVLPALQRSLVDSYTLEHGFWFWLYGSNYLTGLFIWPDRALVHLWSLSIEEHFYMIWPFIIFAANKKQLLVGGSALLVGMVLFRYLAADHGTSNTGIYVMTHFRIDTLVMGGLLALVWRTTELRSAFVRHAGKAFLLLFVVGAVFLSNVRGLEWINWSTIQEAAGYTLIALFFVAAHVLCLGLSHGSILYRILTCAPAIWLGRLSYGMYLFHLPVDVFVRSLGFFPAQVFDSGKMSWVYMVVYILANATITASLAWFTWNFFEKYMLRLKKHFTYQGKKPGDQPVSSPVHAAITDTLK